MLGSTDPDCATHRLPHARRRGSSAGSTTTCSSASATGWPAGLAVGLGENGTDRVFRRGFSVLVLAECIERDTRPAPRACGKVLEWGDRVTAWYVRERDTRGYVPAKGWAPPWRTAPTRSALARSPHLAADGLTVLLDVIGGPVPPAGTGS